MLVNPKQDRPGRRESLAKLLSAEPLCWGIWLGLCQALTKVKSRVWSIALDAPGLHAGPGSMIRGARFIHFGRNIYAHRDLWLEALERYRGQQFHPHITIGDQVCFSDGVHITSIDRIVIQRGVLLGSHILITDHNHGIYSGSEQSLPEEPPAQRILGGGGPVEIGEHAWIGDNAVIIGPVVIGRSAIVGANSIVRHDVPANAIVVGAPARVVKKFSVQTSRWEKV